YDTDILRLNIHLNIYYKVFAKEYRLLVNCNTLTDEDIYYKFKCCIYETNYSNIKKILLMKVNF
ncbi:hypothetical protein GE21DRAFT_1220630, partial [Neurospora crassa]